MFDIRRSKLRNKLNLNVNHVNDAILNSAAPLSRTGQGFVKVPDANRASVIGGVADCECMRNAEGPERTNNLTQ